MTTYFAAPDGIDEPTLWAETDDPRRPVAILRHRDLGPMAHHWDELVARVIAGNPDTASRWTLQQLKKRQDVRADHIERGHKWTIIGGDPTAHCQCGATMNVPVVAESIAESVRRAGEVAMAAHYKTLPPTPELCAGMGCIQDVGHDGPCLDWTRHE